ALFARCVQRRVRLRRMTVAAEALAPPEEQLPLFAEQPSPEQTTQARGRRLALALDHLRERFGESAIRYGRQGAHGERLEATESVSLEASGTCYA
ncbi:MAG: hypothetical protein V3U08_07190, partial [Nitrospirales bacterium]